MRQFGFFGYWVRDLLVGTTGFLLAWLCLYLLYYVYRTRVARKQVRALPSVLTFIGLVFVFSLPYPAFLLELPLRVWAQRLASEHPVTLNGGSADEAEGLPVVVVLGSGVLEPGRLNGRSLKRLDHGIELWRSLPDGSRLLLTEGGLGREGADGEAARRYIRSEGVPEGRLLLETAAGNTRQNMVNSRQLLSDTPDSPIALVTTSRHLPRAYFASRRVGWEPLVSPVELAHDLRFYPRWGAFCELSAVLNEYAGLVGYFLLDWI